MLELCNFCKTTCKKEKKKKSGRESGRNHSIICRKERRQKCTQLFDFDKGKSCTGVSFACENPHHVVSDPWNRRTAGSVFELQIILTEHCGSVHGSERTRTDAEYADTVHQRRGSEDIDALVEYAQEFYPGVPIVMYGHSMGGNITLDYRAEADTMTSLQDMWFLHPGSGW